MSPSTVEVWVAPLDVDAPPLVACLSARERRRAARFRTARDARRFAAAHGWLRHVLGAVLGLSPGDVRLADGAGKPHLAGGRGPRFNLSYSGEVALVAVSLHEVGVDVERVDRPGALEAAAVACTPSEQAALDRLSAPERAAAFLRLWTMKEAYLKARGTGLAVAPDLVEVGPPIDGRAPARTAGEPGPARWWVRELRALPGYVGAVAAEGGEWIAVERDARQLLPSLCDGVGPGYPTPAPRSDMEPAPSAGGRIVGVQVEGSRAAGNDQRSAAAGPTVWTAS